MDNDDWLDIVAATGVDLRDCTHVRSQTSWFFGPGNEPSTATAEFGFLMNWVEPNRFVWTDAVAYPGDRPEAARRIGVGEVRDEHLRGGRIAATGRSFVKEIDLWTPRSRADIVAEAGRRASETITLYGQFEILRPRAV